MEKPKSCFSVIGFRCWHFCHCWLDFRSYPCWEHRVLVARRDAFGSYLSQIGSKEALQPPQWLQAVSIVPRLASPFPLPPQLFSRWLAPGVGSMEFHLFVLLPALSPRRSFCSFLVSLHSVDFEDFYEGKLTSFHWNSWWARGGQSYYPYAGFRFCGTFHLCFQNHQSPTF